MCLFQTHLNNFLFEYYHHKEKFNFVFLLLSLSRHITIKKINKKYNKNIHSFLALKLLFLRFIYCVLLKTTLLFLKFFRCFFIGNYIRLLVYFVFIVGNFVLNGVMLKCHNSSDAHLYTNYLFNNTPNILVQRFGLLIFHRFILLALSGDINPNPGPERLNMETILQEEIDLWTPFNLSLIHI